MSGIPSEGFTNRQIQLIAVCTTCLTLSTVAVGLRLLVRRVASTANLWWDDWIVISALIASWLVNIFTLLGLHNGLGRHQGDVAESNIIPFGVSVWVQQIGWSLSMGLIIISILVFYLRIFPNTWIRRSIYGIGIFMLCWTIATKLGIIFQCTPVQYFWNRKILGGSCINANDFYFAVGLTSTIVLVAVLFLPVPIIWKLQVSKTKRLGLALSFTIGAFVCVCSVIRLVVLLLIDPKDLLFTSALPQLWSCAEVSFGVVSACIPSLTPLALYLFEKLPKSTRQYSLRYPSHSNGKHSHKTSKTNFNRMDDLGDASTRGHSLELIMRGHGNGASNMARVEADGYKGEDMGFEGLGQNDIVVTRQLDQVSMERSAESFGEGPEVNGNTGTQ